MDGSVVRSDSCTWACNAKLLRPTRVIPCGSSRAPWANRLPAHTSENAKAFTGPLMTFDIFAPGGETRTHLQGINHPGPWSGDNRHGRIPTPRWVQRSHD